jgi:dienelactone hydrolase
MGTTKKDVVVWSEGSRISGNLFLPDDMNADEKRPAILLCHGWGGPKEHLNNTYAPFFSEAGFITMTFDYRGWFTSEARLVSEDPQGEPDEDGYLDVKVKAVREVVDPFDQYLDILNCLDFIESEEKVDPQRIGIWGSSYGCGHAIYVAGSDNRIRCMVAQVGGPFLGDQFSDLSKTRAAEKARGVYGALPPGIDAHPTLVGKPDYAKMSRYRANVHNISVPSLLIDQEDEELFDRTTQLPVLYEILKDKVPVSYHTFPGTHYDVYDKNYAQGSRLARDWYLEHL